MRKLAILASKLVVLASLLALSACSSSPTAPAPHRFVPAVHRDGIPCITEDGRSGYLVSAGNRCEA